MALTPGTRLGPYEILSAIGAGGMGEVYQATDTNLKRAVAIKVLPAALAADADRLARFQREAEVLAALNHPHIAAIYGLERSGDTTALVMELVEGEDLSQWIARGAIPIDEALPIAKQIAEALEAAHEQGIIHRDLKPANIKVRADGTVKVLDFGLAKAMDPPSNVRPVLTNSPTITSPAMLTGIGMLLGTAAYMSPEQAKGLPADRRSDVFAFGGVLFEMLSGHPAFPGGTVADVLASVLAREPQFDLLPRTIDPRLVDVLRRCLAKSAPQRWQAIGDLRIELERIATTPRVAAMPTTGRWLRGAAVVATTLAAALVGAVVTTYLRQPPGLPETRLDVTTGDTYQTGGGASYALSPDGRSLVFAAAEGVGVSHLWLRNLGSADARPLPGTERGTVPFWSPDGRSVAFFSDAALKRIDLIDHSTETLATLSYGTGGGAWAADGTILFAPTVSSRLMTLQNGKVAPLAGQPSGLAQSAPELLPDGQQFLFFVTSPAEARGIYVGARDGRAVRRLADADSAARYIDAGWIFFIKRETLLAQRFDVSRAVTSGEPVVVAQGAGSFSAARSGVIAYGAARAPTLSELQWFDRDGTALRDIPAPLSGSGSNPVVGADGRIAWDRTIDGNRDVWVFDRTRSTRLTSDGAVDFVPQWMPGGDQVVFISNRHGVLDLYKVPLNDPTAAQPILESRRDKLVTDVSPDGRVIAFLQASDGGGLNIWTVRADDPQSAAPFVATRSDERGAQFSRDGRWMAYQSDESGKHEIYVRRFPAQAGAGRQQVSTAGGSWPRWSRDGRELYYVDPTGAMMAAGVTISGDALRVAAPAVLFKAAFRTLDPRIHAQYDVDHNGRFLIVTAAKEARASPITIILNWAPPGR